MYIGGKIRSSRGKRGFVQLCGSINAEIAPLYCLTLQKKPVNVIMYVYSKYKVPTFH